jgi:hypothetical protein
MEHTIARKSDSPTFEIRGRVTWLLSVLGYRSSGCELGRLAPPRCNLVRTTYSFVPTPMRSPMKADVMGRRGSMKFVPANTPFFCSSAR